jgi:STE24 endopeptidase
MAVSKEIIFYIIIALFVFEFILSKTLDYLNTKNWSTKLPKELKEIYDEKKYSKSMEYEKVKYSFGSLTWIFSFIIMLLVLVFGGFGWLDSLVRSWTDSYILTGLYFFWIIILIQTLISLPISYYSNFVIEEKFGFNKMTRKLFFVDTIKSLLLSTIIGWWILSLIIFLYTLDENNFWLYAWGVVTFFSIFMMMFYSSVIVPLFNKQTLLEKWKLRNAIEKFAKKVGFKLDNIFVIDWSKRSSKANAYFSWFWPKKRIVLYDTLIKDLEIDELVWVLAHEIWHYRGKHTLQMLSFSILQTWFMLFVFGLALKFPEVSIALWASEWSFWVWAIAFWILFTPISIVLWLFGNILSRKNEYEADEFAWIMYKPEKLKQALIKLSRNNLSNLRPHPAYEFFHYSHPTVLKRLKALSNIKK